MVTEPPLVVTVSVPEYDTFPLGSVAGMPADGA